MVDPQHALHVLAEYPMLAALARRHTEAKKLDGRAIASIYKAHLSDIDQQVVLVHERNLMRELGIELSITTPAALQAHFPYMFPLEGDENRRAYILFRGWLPTLVDVCQKIDALLGANKRGFHWTRLREKYGAPSFAYGMDGKARVAMDYPLPSSVKPVECQTEGGNDAVALQINELVLQVELKLRCTCIVCGAASEINNDRGPWASLCAEHRAETFDVGHKDWKGSVWASAGEGGWND